MVLMEELMGDGTETILLTRIGEEGIGSLHMSELTDLELAELLRDCKDETERRATGASI